MRQTRYQTIADAVRQELDAGQPPAGGLLPSESDLSARHGASRVTVRRALEVLRDEGRVDSRQGFGWFVRTDPVRQSLGHLGTIEGQLSQQGRHPERLILDHRVVSAPAEVARELSAQRVLRTRRLNLADGQPFALVTVWCSEELGGHLSREQVERSPFYELLDVPLVGATQTIGAGLAQGEEAELLGVPEASPVLRCERLTASQQGAIVLVSHHVFPGHLTEFVVDLPQVAPSIAPTGLRLVE